MTHFNGPQRLITLDTPTGGVLSVSVEINLYSEWKEWVRGNYSFNTETDVNGTTERITYTDHSLHTGQRVFYYNDGGSENIGLVDGTEYFVRADDASGDRNTFELYDTEANAEAGPGTTGRMNLTASGVGNGETHRITADNSKFVNAFRTIGGDPLAAGLDAGPYFFLQNQAILAADPLPARDGWRIVSTDEDQTINYQGNLIPEDSAVPIINVTTGRSVLHLGLQPITQRIDEVLSAAQLGNYGGCVVIDSAYGVGGTAYPTGTIGQPSSNLADALTIAAVLGIRKLCLKNTNITLTGSLTNFIIEGLGVDVLSGVALAGQDVSGSVYKNISVSGDLPVLTSPLKFENCRVGNVTDFRGVMDRCGLENTVTIVAGQSEFVECYSNAPTGTDAEIDVQGANLVDLFVRGFIGAFTVSNSTNASSVISLDLLSGVATIDATVTTPTVIIRGVGSYDNQSAVSINDIGLIDQADVRLIKQMTSGNATVSGDDLSVTVYDEDGITVLATFSLSADGRIRTRLT
jgi:hypothetical protein